jgi:hypothetical protein
LGIFLVLAPAPFPVGGVVFTHDSIRYLRVRHEIVVDGVWIGSRRYIGRYLDFDEWEDQLLRSFPFDRLGAV